LVKKVIQLISRDWVNQEAIITSIKETLTHEFIDCGYRLMLPI